MEMTTTCSNEDLECIAEELLARWERAEAAAMVDEGDGEDWEFE